MPAPVIILSPLAHEATALRRALAGHAEVIVTGPGASAVANAVTRHAPTSGPRPLLILAGLAGGLAPTEDVPRITRIIDAHGAAWDVPPSATLPRCHSAALSLLSLDTIVSTPADKRTWHDRTGAVLVDMESHAFARRCTELALPWTVVRGVSDTRDEVLPPQVANWVGPRGSTRPLRVIADMLRRPSLIPAAARLARRSSAVLPQVAARISEIAAAWRANN